MSSDIEQTRVKKGQPMLFPPKPRDVCHNIGLNWLSALWLYEQEFLSFDPKTEEGLDEAQAAELRFLGSLVVAGCDKGMLEHMLRDLRKPYQYHLDRIYYDWSSQKWLALLKIEEIDREKIFQDWIYELEANADEE